MDTKHTPGPWTVDDVNASFAFIQKSGIDVCRVDMSFNSANAALIAAAPELLAWTVELLAQLKRDHPEGMEGIKEHVSKLIARATNTEK